MSENRYDLQPLDLIFRYRAFSDLDVLIAECGLNYGDILINHVGLYIGNGMVIESNIDGVIITSITDFFNGSIYIKRLNTSLLEQDKIGIISKAKSYLKKSYNSTYKDSEDSIYCSELIIRSFEVLENNNPFKRHKITFKNANTNKLDVRWIPIYNNEIEEIPEGDLGSHPTSLFFNDKLVLKFSAYFPDNRN